MTSIMLGNGKNLSVSDYDSNGDTIILGNGINDTVSFSGANDTITLGNGAGDTVNGYLIVSGGFDWGASRLAETSGCGN